MTKLPRRIPPLRRRSDQTWHTPKPISTTVGTHRKDVKPPWRPGLIPLDTPQRGDKK